MNPLLFVISYKNFNIHSVHFLLTSCTAQCTEPRSDMQGQPLTYFSRCPGAVILSANQRAANVVVDVDYMALICAQLSYDKRNNQCWTVS